MEIKEGAKLKVYDFEEHEWTPAEVTEIEDGMYHIVCNDGIDFWVTKEDLLNDLNNEFRIE